MVCLLILTTTSHMTMPDSEGGERLPCVEMLFFKSILSTHLSYSVISEFIFLHHPIGVPETGMQGFSTVSLLSLTWLEL